MIKHFLYEYFSFTRKERNAVIVLLVLLGGFFLVPVFRSGESSVKGIKTDSVLQHAVAVVSAYKDSGYYRKSYKERAYPYRPAYPARHGNMKNYRQYYYSRYGDPVNKASYYKKVSPVITEVLINQADSSALLPLPGIGTKLAARIIAFRDRLGGFYSVEQVAETYGLPDSVFRAIRGRLKLGEQEISRININTADAGMLKKHPYIRWGLANAIIEFRKQHGDFKELKELLQIGVITPEIFNKMIPYLTTGSGDTAP